MLLCSVHDGIQQQSGQYVYRFDYIVCLNVNVNFSIYSLR